EVTYGRGEAGRVEPAGVDDDPDPAFERQGERVLQLPQERTRVPEAGITRAIPGENQHRQLGEVVAGEHVEWSAGEHLAHRRSPVTVEAGAVADAQRGHILTMAAAHEEIKRACFFLAGNRAHLAIRLCRHAGSGGPR